MSKLSFRARALDAAKPMPIYMTEELPDLPDYSAINRAVPQMPSGMEKEEECEHHLQRAICTGLIIPTPEVSNIEDTEAYDRLYTTMYKMPRQLIHMQPFSMEQDIPDYDMDSEDERFVNAQAKKMDLTPLKFEEMMDRLEKGSGQTVVTLQEAKGLLKEDDDLIIAVYDYWLNKRLKTVVPLIPMVKTEHRIGSAANNPYLAFRRRTEKMQTRKNRKNDETSYEKMLKLRRDLSRTVTLLELVKRREKTKRELLHLTIEVFEKRYQAQDFSGQLLAEISAIKTRPAFAPIFSNQFGLNQQHWLSKVPIKEEILVPRKEKRQYKRRKHKENIAGVINRGNYLLSSLQGSQDAMASSEEELESARPEFTDLSQCDSEGMFSFRRKLGCSYLPPTSGFGSRHWCGVNENWQDKRFRFYPTSIATPRNRHIGLARKRIGRGGRVILDRTSEFTDEFWSSVDFTVYDNKSDWPLYQPKTPPEDSENQLAYFEGENAAVDSLPSTLIIDVENLGSCENNNCIHGSDDEQNSDNAADEYSRGGKRKSAEETFASMNKSEESGSELENDSAAVIRRNSKIERETIGRTRTVSVLSPDAAAFDDCKGCVSNRFRFSWEAGSGLVGGRTRVHETTDFDRFSLNTVSDINRPRKNVFRRNYRIGGFKNIARWRKTKHDGCKKKRGRVAFTTSEICLSELFADSSVNLIPETELETNDDSFALLDRLGLDDDFIKKEPEIGLDVDAAVDKAGGLLKAESNHGFSEGHAASFQKQRLKVDKNIFEFSETDFLKYETDCDVDDLLPDLVQNDVVGCCGLFGLTPNSRFNLISPTYLPLECDKIDDHAEGVPDEPEDKAEHSDKKSESVAPSSYGQIADISSDIENHEVTLQLKMNGNVENNSSEKSLTSRLSVKNVYPDGYHLGNGDQTKVKTHQEQAINYVFALNHHNYTISGPPGHHVKHNVANNAQANYEPSASEGSEEGNITGSSAQPATAEPAPPAVATAWKSTLCKSGPGILRTYKGNNAKTVQLISEGNSVIQDASKKSLSNGPATIAVNQKKIVRGPIAGQQQSNILSVQNPTVSHLVPTSNIFAIEETAGNQNFMGANQNCMSQSSNLLGNNSQIVSSNRKISLLGNSSLDDLQADSDSVDLRIDSMETVDIETGEGGADGKKKSNDQEVNVDSGNQMSVRKNNSLPMEVT